MPVDGTSLDEVVDHPSGEARGQIFGERAVHVVGPGVEQLAGRLRVEAQELGREVVHVVHPPEVLAGIVARAHVVERDLDALAVPEEQRGPRNAAGSPAPILLGALGLEVDLHVEIPVARGAFFEPGLDLLEQCRVHVV